jgi:hypothetical protein
MAVLSVSVVVPSASAAVSAYVESSRVETRRADCAMGVGRTNGQT